MTSEARSPKSALSRINNLSIGTKGTIVVAAPMAVGLISLISLFILLYQSEAQIKEESNKKEEFALANNIYQCSLDSVGSATTYALTKQEIYFENYEKTTKESEQIFSRLEKLLEDQPDRLKKLHRMQLLERELVRGFGTMMNLAREGETPADFLKIRGVKSHSQALARQFTEEIASFRDTTVTSNEGEAWRKQLAPILITIALLINLLAILLSVYFNRNITRRLNLVRDNAMLLAAGAPLHSQSTGQDEVAKLDTMFHRMAKSLHEATLRERALVDNALDVICSIDTSNRFTEVNSASREAWGYEASDLMGKRIVEIIAKEDVDATINTLKELADGKQLFGMENRIVKADGEIVQAFWSLHWSPEEKTYFCVIHDITERHEIERMKREFVAMVSHDLRSPLTSLQGTLSLLETTRFGELNDTGITMVKRADRDLARLIQLIDGLLDLEKIQAGKMILEKNTVDLLTVIERSVSSVSYLFEQKNIKVEIAENPVEVFADSSKLVQVVINLLSNASKFSPRNSTVSIFCEDFDSYAEIRIKDQGRGIPAAKLNSVFERFQQVEAKDHSEKGGKGLGLTICKAIVEAHGGTIGVESVEGEGSTFWLRIPQPE
ncbi:MAG: PAS domain S-box protein [Candidatus Obscuribacterales bacterium]|nr:PAS domain S-box protein [Candidatus Obscuribacterales bacterium]